MEKQYKVGIVGATGMVGQRFVTLLENHPWFKLTTLAASGRSAGKTYEDAVGSRWAMTTPMPESVKKMVVLDAAKVEEVASQVDFIFCAVNMPKAEIKALEEAYAKAECPVVSNNSANRFTPDVPMVVPEINADHIEIIPAQRKRLGTKRGFIAVKSNCSLQSYVPALHPLMKDFGVSKALVCTYQAISGAGKTFDRMPEIVDNVIPYIGGEEEKSEREPLKLWGHIEGDKIVSADAPRFTAQCLRVPVSDGHMGAVFVRFANKPSKDEILKAWKEFHGPAQDLNLPSAPKQFLHYFEENDRPQPKLDRMLENGMAVSIGRLREDNQYDYKFVCLSHNTLRGAAGGELLLERGVLRHERCKVGLRHFRRRGSGSLGGLRQKGAVKMALGIVFAVTISHEVQKHIEVFQTQRRLLLGDLFAGVGGVVARAADKVHPPPDIRADDVAEILGIHKADERILIWHDQRFVHGVHPLHGKFHRPPAVEHAGGGIDM